jgi:hypothetical protein
LVSTKVQRRIASLLLTVLLPVSLAADDVAATLHSNGGVLVNKNSVPPSWTLFPGDLIETQSGFPARIQIDGSIVDIGPESVIEFRPDEVVLEHGSVFVSTARAFKVRSGCVVVIPVIREWTEYDVRNTDGKVTVSARKKDVNINSEGKHAIRTTRPDSSQRVTVREGTEQSREEKCGGGYLKSSPPATDGIMNSPYAVGAAGAGVLGGTLCIVLCFDDEPLSRSCPSGKC